MSRETTIQIRVSSEEKRYIEECARDSKLSMSDYLRARAFFGNPRDSENTQESVAVPQESQEQDRSPAFENPDLDAAMRRGLENAKREAWIKARALQLYGSAGLTKREAERQAQLEWERHEQD